MITQKKNVEIESVGVAGKNDSNRVKKYFRLEVRKDVTANILFGCNSKNSVTAAMILSVALS